MTPLAQEVGARRGAADSEKHAAAQTILDMLGSLLRSIEADFLDHAADASLWAAVRRDAAVWTPVERLLGMVQEALIDGTAPREARKALIARCEAVLNDWTSPLAKM